MKKGTKVLITVLIVVVIIIAGLLGFYLKMVSDYKKKAQALDINEIDMTQIADGTYNGFCDLDLVKVEVAVTVKDNKIEKIDLLRHDNGKGQPAERIIDDIVEQQKIEVDSVTGATYSSIAIKYAVVDALSRNNMLINRKEAEN